MQRVLAKAREQVASSAISSAPRARKRKPKSSPLVRAQVATTIDEGRKTIAGEAKTARTALDAESAVLGKAIATRVLGREVST